MPETPSAVRPLTQDDRPRAQPSRGIRPHRDLRVRLSRIAGVCGATIAVVIAAVILYLLVSTTGRPPAATLAVLASAVSLCGVVLLVAVVSMARSVREQLAGLRQATFQHHQEIEQVAERVRRGERPYPRVPESPPVDSDEWRLLAHDLDRLRYAATSAVAAAPAPASDPVPGDRVGVFVNLARRLQSLVHREIQLLDELESQVEDPELLKGLFSVDHLATRIRRHAENLAVLGGAVTRRQWSRPVNLYEVLRSAVAEVERYSRVKLVRPIEGTVQGHAVADVIHLVAELVENATMFSNPQTQVLLRAQRVTAGLAVEVEDRGLGMPLEEQHRVNAMLAVPDQVDIDELLRDGRIGLFVVSALARRHGIAVQLQTNIYGGIQAVVVLPPALLGPPPVSQQPQRDEAQRQIPAPTPRQIPAPAPAMAAPVQTLPAPAMSLGSPPSYPVDATGGFDYPAQPVAATVGGQSIDSPTAEQRLPTIGTGVAVASAPHLSARRSPAPEEAMRPMPTTPEASGGAAVSTNDQPDDPRPPLPHRRVQAHLTPQLREAPTDTGEPSEGPDPGLMSAFQRGFNHAGAHPDDAGAGPGHSPTA